MTESAKQAVLHGHWNWTWSFIGHCIIVHWSFTFVRMRPLRSLFLYVAAVFVGAALLAPWIYWLMQWAASQSSSFAGLSSQPFHRYVNRALLLLAIAGLWPFLRS